MGSWIWVVDWLSYEVVVIFWLRLTRIEVSLDVTWEVSVSGVINIFDWEEVVWLVEFIKLVGGENFVVLDTITIFIVDFISVGVDSFFPDLIVKSL